MNQSNNPIKFNRSAEVGMCTNTPVPVTLPPGTNTLVKIPVVLTELDVTSSLVCNITFPDPVLEIKDIKKRLKIVQSRLVQTSTPTGGVVYTLFLRGFVRKNIQYATPCPSATDPRSVSSEMRSMTLDVPFECSTTIPRSAFYRIPELPRVSTRSEFEIFRVQNLGPGFPEKDKLLSSDLSEFHQNVVEEFNEDIFAELVACRMTEWDEATDRTTLPNGPFEEGYFQNIVEKISLSFRIKLLQKQQGFINFVPFTP